MNRHNQHQPNHSHPPAAPTKASREEIENRAYAIYVENGCQEGRCLENWLQAERELSSQSAAAGQAMESEGGPVRKAGRDMVDAASAKASEAAPVRR